MQIAKVKVLSCIYSGQNLIHSCVFATSTISTILISFEILVSVKCTFYEDFYVASKKEALTVVLAAGDVARESEAADMVESCERPTL